MSSSESNTETLEKHYRVVLDFRVLVRAITPQVCQESFFFNDESPLACKPYLQENIDRQRHLYEILRENGQMLERYLLSVLTQEAGRFACEGLVDAFDVQEENELLIPLYKGMAKEDARFFEECRESGTFMENTDLISTAVKVEWVGTEVAEMSRRIVGDVKRAEVVERTKKRLIKKLNSLH